MRTVVEYYDIDESKFSTDLMIKLIFTKSENIFFTLQYNTMYIV